MNFYSLIDMNFTVYSKDGCPYCEMIKQIFVGKDLQFIEYKLDQNFTKQQFYDDFGEGATFPQITLDGEKLGGCTDTVQHLREQKVI